MADDLITALVLRERRAEWATVLTRRNETGLAAQKSVDLEWPEGVSDPASPEAAAYLKSALGLPRDSRLSVSLSTDQTLLRVADMPTTDAEELRGMCELQVDKFSPFPSDQMYISFEVLSQTADTSRVLIGAAPRDRVDPVGDALAGAGVHPLRVDVEVLGWWRLLNDEGKLRGSGQEVFLIIDEGRVDLIVTRDGEAVLFRALDAGSDLDHAEGAAEIAEELNYTLTTLDGQWGGAAASHLSVWNRGPVPSALIESLNQLDALDVSRNNLEALPTLSEGLARRMTSNDTAMMDLSPPGWGMQRQAKGYQRIAIKAAVIIFIAWGVIMGAVLGLAAVQRNQLVSAQQEFNRLRDERQAVVSLREQVLTLEQYGDRTYSGLECLREISSLLPDGVDITQFTYRKAGQVNLRGEADQSGPIYEFINRLEASELFTEIRPEGVTSQTRGGQSRSIFRLTVSLPGSEEEEGDS